MTRGVVKENIEIMLADPFGGVTFAMAAGGILFLVFGIVFQAIPEAIGRGECRDRLEAMGIEEPEEWPNCNNLGGQRIMRERYAPQKAPTHE